MRSNSDIKKGVIDFPEPRTVESQAFKWLAKLDSDEISSDDVAAFQQWIGESEEHRGKFQSALEYWDELNVLTQMVTPSEIVSPLIKKERKHVTTCFKSRLAFGGLALAALLVFSSVMIKEPWHKAAPLSYSTGIGEQSKRILPDNSTVMLNTGSRVDVSYTPRRRSVTLAEGEAYFEVSHDPDRPFEVNAGRRLVRAVGTAFSVRVGSGEEVEVLVTEGVVKVGSTDSTEELEGLRQPLTLLIRELRSWPISEDAEPPIMVAVEAGNSAQFEQNAEAPAHVAHVSNIHDKLSWRQGTLTFDNAPLEQVVNEFNRYTRLKIRIPEAAVRGIAIGGVFRTGDTESLFEALHDGFGIEVQYVSEDTVNLVSISKG